ncbi:MAG: STAS domain-containing protein [Deltaproteobacteria bacterium]|nr:STAS domain-containing protein [Deltaproteobacteria bacterium]
MQGAHVVNDCLLATVSPEIDELTVHQWRNSLLTQAHEEPLRGVIIDVSAVRYLDTSTFGLLATTARMLTLLGLTVVFVGFAAGVAAALIDLGVETDGINTVITMEDAFRFIDDAG